MERVLNWKPSPIDERDFKFNLNFPLLSLEELSPFADLSSSIPEIWDQEDIGACTCFSTGMSVLFQSKVQNRPIDPSKLFLYYNVRKLEGTINEDSGAYIRDVFKTLNKEGVCKEQTWPYITSKFTDLPDSNAYGEALQTLGTKYHSLNNSVLELKNCIAQGRPFVFGFNVYSSFMYGSWTSIMPIPKPNEGLLGGHAVLAVGYDDSKQAFKIKNSWGKSWKEGGYFWMPYSFITSNQCDDFWTLEGISELTPTPTPDPTPVPVGCLDPLKLFTSFKELKTFSKAFLFRLADQMGLSPEKVSKESLLLLLKTNLKL